jgi:site-specific DNA-methyltransferase (adenine-specific)
MITKRQKQTLDFIKSYQKRRSYSPSLEEIKKHLKLSSVSTAHHHVKALESLGYIGKEENSPRSINPYQKELLVQLPLLGTIAAGQPIIAVEEKEYIAVPKSKLPKSGSCYALRVDGDSMIEENIDSGDIVIIRDQSTAENGQKVVALLNNEEVTLKKFYKEKNHIRLQPANKNLQPIIAEKEEVKIQGVLIDVIKNENHVESELNPLKPALIEIEERTDIAKFLDKIICGDAIENLKKIPDKSIDLIVADPPYNLSQGNQLGWSGSSSLKGFGGKWDKVMENWDNMPLVDYFNFTYSWLSEAKRVLKPTGSIWVFGTYHNIGVINLIFQILGIEIINEVVWYKRNSFPNLSGRRLTASHETLIWGHAGEKKRKYLFNYEKSKEYFESSDLLKQRNKQMRTVWDIPNNKEREEIRYGKHPTQKPLKVCKRIIALTSKEGDVVLSPFAGAGTECLAASELGRRYLGLELDPMYVKIANKRLSMSKTKNMLFQKHT